MIEVSNLTFSYPGAKQKTLKGLDFAVNQGEIFGFLGPSGAGKSTTQKILIGLLKEYEGNVTVMGKEIKAWNRDYYEQVGISFELPNLYQKLTGMENLNLIRSFYGSQTEEPMELLKMVGLEGSAHVKVSQYSKGMKMRLNLVRAFIHRPNLVFLDEPTSGLDPVNAKNVKDIIRKKKEEGKTIFLTTHNMTVADELCDRIAFIVDGEIKRIDSPKELKIQYGKRRVKVEYDQNETTAYQEFELKGIGYNRSFIELLQKYPVKTIHTQEATLEDIFIRTTGRRLL